MTDILKIHPGRRSPLASLAGGEAAARHRRRGTSLLAWGVICAAALVAPLVFAQAGPHIAAVDPTSGKVNDNVTVTGENLGKSSVSGLFLSDDKTDYKATIVEQDDGKIVMKVPVVKPGNYNVSYQEGNKIIILPFRFTVQE